MAMEMVYRQRRLLRRFRMPGSRGGIMTKDEALEVIRSFVDKGGSGHICGISSEGLSDKDIITIAESMQSLLKVKS